MNAIFLHLPDGTATEWSMCSVCHMVASPGNLDLSEKCCACYDCGEPLPKDERTPYATGGSSSLYHRVCERRRREACEADILEKAEIITDYTGPVYLDGVPGSAMGEGYFRDIDYLAESLDFLEGQRHEFAHCCVERGFSLDGESILESATEEMYEDCWEDLSGTEEFLAAVDAFNKANESIKTWECDNKRKVAIPTAASQ